MTTATKQSVAELKKQLAAAEAAEKKSRSEQMLAPFRELTGKCFSIRFPTRGGSQRGFVRYGKVTLQKAWDESQSPSAEIIVDRICAMVLNKPCYANEGLTRVRDTFRSHMTYDLTRHHVAEISPKQFKMIWHSVELLAASQMSRWKEEFNDAAPDLEWPEHDDLPFKEEELLRLDIPFVQLEGMERSILSWGKPFLISGGQVYLITPKSLELARRIIDDHRKRDSRTSYLAEACDMRYLQDRSETMDRLEKKLKL